MALQLRSAAQNKNVFAHNLFAQRAAPARLAFASSSNQQAAKAAAATNSRTGRTYATSNARHYARPDVSLEASNGIRSAATRLTFTQTSICLLVLSAMMAVSADCGLPGLLMLMTVVAGSVFPVATGTYVSFVFQLVAGITTIIKAAVGVKTDKAKTAVLMMNTASIKGVTDKTATKLPRGWGPAAPRAATTPSAAASANASPTDKLLRANCSTTKVKVTSFKTAVMPNHPGSSTTQEDKSTEADVSTLRALATATLTNPTVTLTGSTTPASPAAEESCVQPPSPTEALPSGYLASQLCRPAFPGPQSVLALCVELTPQALPVLINVSKDFVLRGGVTGKALKPDVLAQRQQKQREWEAEELQGGGLPRVAASSLAEVLSFKWSALKLFVATPLDWGVNGAKQVTWGDMRLLDAYGIPAAAAEATTGALLGQQGGDSGAGVVVQDQSGSGAGVVAAAVGGSGVGSGTAKGGVGVCTGVSGVVSTAAEVFSVVPAAAAGPVAAAAVAAVSSSLCVGEGVTAAAKGPARGKKGFGRRLFGHVAKATVPLVTSGVLMAKASLLLGGAGGGL